MGDKYSCVLPEGTDVFSSLITIEECRAAVDVSAWFDRPSFNSGEKKIEFYCER